MGSGGGFGGGNKGGFSGNMPEGFDPSQFGGNGQGNNSGERPSTDKSTDEQTSSDSAEAPNTESGRPSTGKTGLDRSSSDKSGFNMGSFSGFSGSSSNNDATQYILLGVSAAILLVGVLAGKTIMHQRKAVRYKRKFKICQNEYLMDLFLILGRNK